MSGMVEKTGKATWLIHLGLIIGIGIVCFPIYLAFVASSVTQAELVRPHAAATGRTIDRKL